MDKLFIMQSTYSIQFLSILKSFNVKTLIQKVQKVFQMFKFYFMMVKELNERIQNS